MAEIERFRYIVRGPLVPLDSSTAPRDGDLVRYSDHEQALQAEREKREYLEGLLKNWEAKANGQWELHRIEFEPVEGSECPEGAE